MNLFNFPLFLFIWRDISSYNFFACFSQDMQNMPIHTFDTYFVFHLKKNGFDTILFVSNKKRVNHYFFKNNFFLLDFINLKKITYYIKFFLILMEVYTNIFSRIILNWYFISFLNFLFVFIKHKLFLTFFLMRKIRQTMYIHMNLACEFMAPEFRHWSFFIGLYRR